MTSSEHARYAIYAAPPVGSVLADLGNRWLGRDVVSGAPLDRPPLPDGPVAHDAEALTAAPRHYGFHGTLKAPFALREHTTGEDLIAAVDRFAETRAPVLVPSLTVATLGRFVALVPAAPCEALNSLAAACVESFDGFRAPPAAGDLARRRAAGLTPTQQALLDRWGYPHVMEDFRFHMTLTGPIEDSDARERAVQVLGSLFTVATRTPFVVESLAVFHQPDRSTPFRLIHRAPLLGSDGPP